MAITTHAQLLTAMAKQRFTPVYKATVSGASDNLISHWRAAGGSPDAAGAVPSSPEILNYDTPGGIQYPRPAAGNTLYVSGVQWTTGQGYPEVMFHDRLAHVGGVVCNITTLQTVNLDISGTDYNLVQRRGSYRDVQWRFEVNGSAVGSTVRNITTNVTYEDDSTGTAMTVATIANINTGRTLPIVNNHPTLGIKRIDSVQFDGSTGSASNLAVVASRLRAAVSIGYIYERDPAWGPYYMGLPIIYDQSCLTTVYITNGTTTQSMGGRLFTVEG